MSTKKGGDLEIKGFRSSSLVTGPAGAVPVPESFGFS